MADRLCKNRYGNFSYLRRRLAPLGLTPRFAQRSPFWDFRGSWRVNKETGKMRCLYQRLRFPLSNSVTIPEFSKPLTSATFTQHRITALHALGSWLAVTAICCCWGDFYEWISAVRDASSTSQETHSSTKVYWIWLFIAMPMKNHVNTKYTIIMTNYSSPYMCINVHSSVHPVHDWRQSLSS